MVSYFCPTKNCRKNEKELVQCAFLHQESQTVDNHSAFGRSRVALKTFVTEKEAQNFLKYATSEIIRFAFLLTDESLTSLAKKVPDLLDYSDENGIIDYNRDVNAMLYKLFDINEINQQYIREVLALKK